MIWLFFLVLLGLANAAVWIESPRAGQLVDTSSYKFIAKTYWVGDVTDTPPNEVCYITVRHGGGSTTEPVSIKWSCEIREDTSTTPPTEYQACTGSIEAKINGLEAGLGGWSVSCPTFGNAFTGASSCDLKAANCILYDLEDPVINVISPEDGENYEGPIIPIQYGVEDDNPYINCTVYIDGGKYWEDVKESYTATFYQDFSATWGPHLLNVTCKDATIFYRGTKRESTQLVNFKRWVPDTAVV
ncbi:MAG: hypothetical protein GXN92_02805, partial [Candidatus Micrarchaeota archaeon]|nr:hypothetical protein [Candidatus Micrarchaeota archaeon]